MAFRIGEPVICEDDGGPAIHGSMADSHAKRGRRYHVSAARDDPWTGIPAVQLAELPAEDLLGFAVWYQARRFRRAVELKTDLKFAQEILDRENHGLPSRVDYPADCEPK